MPETYNISERKIRHRGRIPQIFMILGKFFRMFVYQNDWKVFPLSALIAGLLAYVIRSDFMKTMEGTIKGAFAISCVAIWNGCFNSIQVICRERETIKREHRSGMHISSYIIAHMIYQAVLCVVQTIILLDVFKFVKIELPAAGFLTNWFRLDLGITIFLITYCSDMLALLVSAIVKTTTGAMTVMPFILIFQLVFSGGIFTLPSWSKPFTKISISHYGLDCIAAQSDYNSLPLASAWLTLSKMRDTPIEGTVTIGEVLQLLDEDTAAHSDLIRELRETDLAGLLEQPLKAGDVIDYVMQEPNLESVREKEFEGSVTIGEIMDIFGENEVRQTVNEYSAGAGKKPEYERTSGNIFSCWFTLAEFALLYVLLAMIALEFVDKDKR